MSKPKITVAIPTLGRETLKATLRSLERQTVAPDEVLAINQGDPALAEQLQFDLPLRVLNQDARGLSRARNRALQEFQGDWVLWTDDDQEVAVDWVEQLHALIAYFPKAAFFGGAVLPPLDYDRANSYMDQLYILGDVAINLETYLRPQIPHPLLQHDIWGGNYALSRRLIDQVGRYDECLGRGSKHYEKGEDTDFNMRYISQGFEGVLSARLIIYHTFGARPMTPALAAEGTEVAAVVAWKARQAGAPITEEMAGRIRPFGRKKAQLAALTRGALFPDHHQAKQIFDQTLAKLDAGYTLVDGCLKPKA